MPTSLGIMQILLGPPPPPPPWDGPCWPTPQAATAGTRTANRVVRTALDNHARRDILLPPFTEFRSPFAEVSRHMSYSSPFRKNSLRNTAVRSRTPSTKSCQVLGTPASIRPLRKTAMIRTPSTVPPIVPDPP